MQLNWKIEFFDFMQNINFHAIILEEKNFKKLFIFMRRKIEDEVHSDENRSLLIMFIIVSYQISYSGLVWFICLMAYQLLMGYLKPKFD